MYLQKKVENDAQNELIIKQLLSDKKWALLVESEIIVHGEDSDLFEFKNFWEARDAAFDAMTPIKDPLAQFEKISDSSLRKNLKKQRNFPARMTKVMFLRSKPEFEGKASKDVFKNCTPALDKEWEKMSHQFNKDRKYQNSYHSESRSQRLLFAGDQKQF